MALLLPDVIQNMEATLGTTIALGGLSLFFLREHDHSNGGYFNNLPPLPEVPGLLVVGNLLQLKEKKPHKTFTKWAETYGPIYSIKTGSTSMDVAKEAMVTRFPSILTRKLSNALKILTLDKTMVAMSDYDEFHKMIKRHLLTNVLGPNAQEMNCYIDYLLSEAKILTNQQMSMLHWETIIETSDTTSVTTEWAMYELAEDPKRQERLYHEIQIVFGSDKISEEKICQLPYLSAVFHETLRKYSPAPIIPLRYVHEDTSSAIKKANDVAMEARQKASDEAIEARVRDLVSSMMANLSTGGGGP